MFAVLNHYKRKPDKVVNLLKEQGVTPVVFTDPTDYYAKRNSIDRYTGLSGNYLNIMEHKTEDKWKVIVHDDIAVIPDLVNKIEHILEFAPDAIVSFYNPTNLGYQNTAESGKHVMTTYSNFWSQCHAIPTELSYEFAEWCREHVKPFGYLAEDGMVHCWATLTNRKIYAVVPSLAQHDGYAQSIFKNPAKAGKYFRYSETYNPSFNVELIDWQAEFADPYPENKRRSNFDGIDGQMKNVVHSKSSQA